MLVYKNFRIALEFTLLNEGGFSNYKEDSGGATNMGITQKTLSEYLNREATLEEVHGITFRTARSLYLRLFWLELNLENIDDPRISSAIFDRAVLFGVKRTAFECQAIIGVKQDGYIGPQTIEALNTYDPELFIKKLFVNMQIMFCHLVEKNEKNLKFIEGWINRSHKIISIVDSFYGKNYLIALEKVEAMKNED